MVAAVAFSVLGTEKEDAHDIPVEVLARILGHLAPKDLGTASIASRAFYAGAVLAGLCICCKIDLRRGQPRAPQFTAFKESVRRAQASGVRLGLDVSCPTIIVSDQRDDKLDADVLGLLSCVANALSNFHSLSLQLPDAYSAKVTAALRHAAPRLRSFSIRRTAFDEQDPCKYALPSDIFEGNAPQLAKVTLGNITLASSDKPIPAFRHVHSLYLEYRVAFPDVPVALHFPKLAHLYLDFKYKRPDPAQPYLQSSLRGLTLTSIVVEDLPECAMMPLVARALDLRSVPDISYNVKHGNVLAGARAALAHRPLDTPPIRPFS